MGILDDLLGGLAGQGMGGHVQQRQTRAADGGTGMNQVLMALMPVVLGMLANRGSRGASPTQANSLPGAGGGLADVLGQMLGGATRGGAAGGLGGLLEQLQCSGFGEQANSWVSRGPNQPISPGAMAQILWSGWPRADLAAGGDQPARGIAGPLPAPP